MPSFHRLSDDEIARILTFVGGKEMAAGGPTFTAAEIAEERKHPLSPQEVLLERQKLEQQSPLP